MAGHNPLIVMMRVLIIEDEPNAARELSKMLQGLVAELQLLDSLASVQDSIEWLQSNPAPELIFSDIQLGDGLSFEIFTQVQVQAPVIFCTAYDQYAIQAFEVNGIDYLLKPIDPSRLQMAIQKFERLRQSLGVAPSWPQNLEKLLRDLSPIKKSSTFLVQQRESIVPLRSDDILFIHSTDRIVSAFARNQQKYFLNHTMEELEAQLDARLFYRANRQFIIHRDAIGSAEPYFGRKLLLKLNCPVPEAIYVSKPKTGLFLNWWKESF